MLSFHRFCYAFSVREFLEQSRDGPSLLIQARLRLDSLLSARAAFQWTGHLVPFSLCDAFARTLFGKFRPHQLDFGLWTALLRAFIAR